MSSATPPANRAVVFAVGDPAAAAFVTVSAAFRKSFPDVSTPAELLALPFDRRSPRLLLERGGKTHEVLEIPLEESRILWLFREITTEIAGLRRLRDQLRDLTEKTRFYEEILHSDLPLGLMVIDEDCRVMFASAGAKRLFHIPSKANLTCCFHYLQRLTPCEHCPLPEAVSGRPVKKRFTVAGRAITGELLPCGESFVYIFRETTREIELLQQIKEQQETLRLANARIAEQNELLRHLSAVSLRLGEIGQVESILESVVLSIAATFHSDRGAAVLCNRAGKIDYAYFSPGVEEREKPAFTQQPLHPWPEHHEYIAIDLGGEAEFHGRIFLHRPGKALDRGIIDLFAMQVSAVLKNLTLQRRLEELAQTDGLTRVFNRYYFDRRFVEERERSIRFGQPLSMILVDVNGLKAVNDLHGHAAGDALLCATARILRENISVYDSIYRLGGDEFVILLANCPEAQLRVMEDLLKEVQEVAVCDFDGQNFPVRFSVGGSCSAATEYDKMKEVADRCMYAHKEEFYRAHARYR